MSYLVWRWQSIDYRDYSAMIKFCHDKELPMPLLHVKMSMGQSERRHGRDKEDKEEGSGKSEGGTGIDAATPAY